MFLVNRGGLVIAGEVTPNRVIRHPSGTHLYMDGDLMYGHDELFETREQAQAQITRNAEAIIIDARQEIKHHHDRIKEANRALRPHRP